MEDLNTIVLRQKKYVADGTTHSISFRVKQLKILEKAIKSETENIIRSIRNDFYRPQIEIYTSEIAPVLWEIETAIKSIHFWNHHTNYPIALINRPGHLYSRYKPFGSVLIIGPWNYPFGLLFTPLVSSIAAGNSTILKPSEFTPATSRFISEFVKSLFAQDFITSVEGEADVSNTLIHSGVDFVFFTGGKETGKKVMQEASQNLIPVVLELGGKNPCIVDNSAPIDKAAKRTIWGKFFNAGQTCVAPDYCLVQESIKELFVKESIACIKNSYGENIKQNGSFTKIINEYHFKRIVTLLENENIIYGGKTDISELFIEPTLIEVRDKSSKVMVNEIFGPILPIITYADINEAITFILNQDPSLAVYCFTKDRSVKIKVLSKMKTGTICFNGTLHSMLGKGAPFGGVGKSGFGRYHGKSGFEAFSYQQAVMEKSVSMEMPGLYPPYKHSYDFVNRVRKIFL